jgi:hypothetical protein
LKGVFLESVVPSLILVFASHLLVGWQILQIEGATALSLFLGLVSWSGHLVLQVSLVSAASLLLKPARRGWSRFVRVAAEFGIALFAVFQFLDFFFFAAIGNHLLFLKHYYNKHGFEELLKLLQMTGLSTGDLVQYVAMLPAVSAVVLLLGLLSARVIGVVPFCQRLRVVTLLVWSFVGLSVVALEQLAAKSFKDPRVWTEERGLYPFYVSFLVPNPGKLEYRLQLRQPLQQGAGGAIPKGAGHVGVGERPPIFFFVLESARSHFLTQDVMPNLHALSLKATAPRYPLSNSNATIHGVFGLFSSRFPFHFAKTRQHPSDGALPLQLLRRAGYALHVMTSADLTWMNLSQTIFGGNDTLLSSLKRYSGASPDVSDRANINALLAVLRNQGESLGSSAYIVFLDSPHHNYHYPSNTAPRFSPVVDSISFRRLVHDKEEVDGIRNRYKNSLFYLDSLIGEVLGSLKEAGHFDRSLLVFVGDHGEAFYEKRKFTHASRLDVEQISPVMVLKFPGQQTAEMPLMMSQVDIFPTLLARLGLTIPSGLVDGRPVEVGNRSRCQLISQNSDMSEPKRFAFVTPSEKLHFQLVRSGTAAYSAFLSHVTDLDDVWNPAALEKEHEASAMRVFKQCLDETGLFEAI